MNLGKGLLFSTVGALAGAVLWIVIIKLTGLSLWILAPIVGGAAGFGMMKATQMRGGLPAGIIAAALTLVAIFGARYFVVSQEVSKHLTLSDEDAFALLVSEVATDMERRGVEVYDEDGDYTPRVNHIAGENWNSWSQVERRQFVAARQGETNQAASILTPPSLLFDFGIFGTICAALAAGTAFKTGSVTLEKTLVEKGLAVGEEDAAAVAANMRAEDAKGRSATRAVPRNPKAPAEEPTSLQSSGGRWSVPMRAADERPLPKIKVISSEDDGRAGGSDDTERKVA